MIAPEKKQEVILTPGTGQPEQTPEQEAAYLDWRYSKEYRERVREESYWDRVNRDPEDVDD